MEFDLGNQQQKELLRIARQTITRACLEGAPASVDTNNQPDIFLRQAASFVTLNKEGNLRGCIGSLKAHRPLIEDVVHNAFASAFRDPRFPPVNENELALLNIEISILTPQQPLEVSCREELLNTLRPDIDGLVIKDGHHSATFLPQVWGQLQKPEQFLQHLMQKAGLPADHWSDQMECYRYQCVKLTE